MKYAVHFRGEPLLEVETLVAGYIAIRNEFKKRWPSAIYGSQEAAAHGFTLVGKPELTPEEARAMRTGAPMPGEPEGKQWAAALRPGRA